MNDNDKKSNLPVHVILGATIHSKIKTATTSKIDKRLEPISKLTTLGRTMMSAGCRPKLPQTRISGADYQELLQPGRIGFGRSITWRSKCRLRRVWRTADHR